MWPKRALQSALADATQAVVVASKGRAVPAGNLHITLAFLGSVPVKDIGQVEAVARRVAGKVQGKAVQIALDGLELWKKAQLLCAITQAEHLDPGAVLLANMLKSHLGAADFSPDLKPFRPHVTLARKVSHLPHTTPIDPVVWSFTDFALAESRTEPQGASYRVLQLFPLIAQQS